MTVVYIDSVFFLNLIMDYLLLLIAGKVSGVPLRRRRYISAAILGAVYAVAIFLPGGEFLSAGMIKAAVWILMSLIAFGKEYRLLRLSLVFLGISCAMAGMILILGLLSGTPVPLMNGIFYTDVDGKTLLIAAGSAYLLCSLVSDISFSNGIRGRLLLVTVNICGRKTELTALWDSGNTLRDPVKGQPVLVVSSELLRELFPPQFRHCFTQKILRAPADAFERLMEEIPELHPALLPYRSVGTAAGFLLSVRTEWIEVEGGRYEGIRVALSPTALGTEYMALWGGERKQNGKRIHLSRTLLSRHRKSTGDSLYWRQ